MNVLSAIFHDVSAYNLDKTYILLGRDTLQILVYISNWIVPFIVLSIVIYGLLANINVYETFIRGAKSGFLTVIRIMPTLIGLMAAVGILRASGFLDFLSEVIGRFSSYIGFPENLYRSRL